MVTVTGFKTVVTDEGDQYIRLILSGDMEIVQSSKTGNFYATSRSCSISCTFTENEAKLMIGKTMPGKIVKLFVQEPYSLTLENGEEVSMNYRWTFTSNEEIEVLYEESKDASSNGVDLLETELAAA